MLKRFRNHNKIPFKCKMFNNNHKVIHNTNNQYLRTRSNKILILQFQLNHKNRFNLAFKTLNQHNSNLLLIMRCNIIHNSLYLNSRVIRQIYNNNHQNQVYHSKI